MFRRLIICLCLLFALPAAALDFSLRIGAGSCLITGMGYTGTVGYVDCSTTPGWSAGQLIRVSNLAQAGGSPASYSPVNSKDWYVKATAGNALRWELWGAFDGSSYTSPSPNPGTIPSNSSIRLAASVQRFAINENRPRMVLKRTARAFRCATASLTLAVEGDPCLISVVVASDGIATATFAESGQHRFRAGRGIGVWHSPTAALNSTNKTILSVSPTQVTWSTGAPGVVPAGTYTTVMISERAHDNNPRGWTRLVESCSGFVDYNVWGAEPTGERNLGCAVVYYITRDSTALTRARFIVDNPSELAYGTYSCDESVQYCNARDDAADYVRGFSIQALKVYDLLIASGALNTTDQALFRSKMLNDRSDPGGCLNPQTTYPAGSITTSLGSTTVTGSGTDFTQLHPGGVLWIVPDTVGPPISFGGQYRDDSFIYRIASITDATHLTMNKVPQNFSSIGTFAPATSNNTMGWMYNRPWVAGDCAARFLGAHHPASLFTDMNVYPLNHGQTDSSWYTNNLVITSAHFALGLGIAFAGQDDRADRLYQDAWLIYADYQMASNMSHLASSTPMGTGYRNGRGIYHSRIVTRHATLVPSYPSLYGDWLYGTMRLMPYSYNGGSWSGGGVPGLTDQAFLGQTGEDAPNKRPYDVWQALPDMEVAEMPEEYKRAMLAFLDAYDPDFTASLENATRSAVFAMEGIDPQLTPLDLTTLPLGQINDSTTRNICFSLGLKSCRDANYVYGEFVSRDRMTYGTSSRLLVVGSGTGDQDHLTPMHDAWWLNAGKHPGRQRCLIGSDDIDCARYHNLGSEETKQKNAVWMSGHPWELINGSTAITTYRANRPEFFAVRNKAQGAYFGPWPNQAGPEKLHLDYMRFLPGTSNTADDFIVVRTDVKANSASAAYAGVIKRFTHYGQNGQTKFADPTATENEGDTTCAGSACPAGTPITANYWSKTLSGSSAGLVRIVSNSVFPKGGGIRRVENADGSYATTCFGTPCSGWGYTFRTETCASSDGSNCATNATEFLGIDVHKVGLSADADTLTLQSVNVGAWDGVIAAGNRSNVLAIFSATEQTSIPSIVTTSTVRMGAMPLAPGTYTVRRNGVPVSGCSGLVVTTDGTLFCDSIASGTIDAVLDGAPPAPVDITTTSPLASCAANASCSRTINVTGGTPPYTCSLLSGAVPTGMTLSSACVLSGTPTTPGTFIFGPQATDSVSATDPAPPTLSILITAAATNSWYVSAAGSDSGAGTIGDPWLTLAKVNATATAGDTVYLRRGDRWRQGPFVVQGSTLTYGAYGVGAAPIVDGSDLKSWTNTSGNIWTASVVDDPFFVMFAGVTGIKAGGAGAVDSANEWFWSAGTLTVFHVGSPASVVEVPTRDYGIVSQVSGSPRNNVTIRDIEFRGSRYYNIKNSAGSGWLVENVIADHSGHGGIVFELVDGVTVRNSRISYANQLGAAALQEALTLQGVNGFTVADNTLYNNAEDGIDAKYNARNGTISGNLIYNGGAGPCVYVDAGNNITVIGNYCHSSLVNNKAGIGLAVESGANPSNYNLHTITVVGNTVVGHATGIWIWLEDGAEAFADVHTIKIWHNTLTGNNKTNWGGIFVYGAGTAANYGAGNEIRNNIVYGNVGTQIWDIVSGGVVASEFLVTHNLFKTGDTPGVLGTSSITTADVLFVGSGDQPYKLQAGSPARNAATVLAGIGRLNIGAHESPSSWYVSPAVTNTSGNGTIGNPCGLAAVLEGNCATTPAIAPGDTIYLRGGTHVIGRYGPTDTPWRNTSLAGNSANPITFRPYPGETAIIDGGIHFNGADVTVRDLIFFCAYNTRISAQSGPFPTDMPLPDLGAYAARIRFINNVVYGQSVGIALWQSAPDSLAYGNLIFYTGWQGTDRGHGHGFYIQNNTGQHQLRENIVFQTFGQGAQVYGTGATNLNNVLFEGNVFFNGGYANNSPSRNLLIGGDVIANDMVVRNNFMYTGTAESNGSETNLGYRGGSGDGCANMLFQDNFAISGIAALSVSGGGGLNGETCAFNGSTGGNTIYGGVVGTLPGSNTLLTAGTRPSTAASFVRANAYEPGRANIIVLNWPRSSSVSVSLAGIGLSNGDTFAIRDVQNFFGAPLVSGTYTGANVTIPMTSTATMAPGVTMPFAIVHTESEFGAFVVRKEALAVSGTGSVIRGTLRGTIR